MQERETESTLLLASETCVDYVTDSNFTYLPLFRIVAPGVWERRPPDLPPQPLPVGLGGTNGGPKEWGP